MVEKRLESLLFASRWLLAVFYLGLVGVLALFALKFGQKLYLAAVSVFVTDINDLIIFALKLIDITLVANLILIVVLAGYENFVSSFDLDTHPDRPDWLSHIGVGDLKIKLFTSIVAISAIQLLESYMNMTETNKTDLAWLVGVHLVFVVSGLLLAWLDRLQDGGQSDTGASSSH
jgi:uncharacterized protein (TIGR00645 family)